MNIVLIGMPGSGKTTIGKMLAQKLNLKFIDMDSEIERSTNKTINDIFEDVGEAGFREIESETIEKISNQDNSVISLGGGAILREINTLNVKKNGKVIFINRPVEAIVNDVEIEKRPLLKDGPDKVYILYNQRIELYKEYAGLEILNNTTIEDVVNKIWRMFK